jgi:hypothetical protein
MRKDIEVDKHYYTVRKFVIRSYDSNFAREHDISSMYTKGWKVYQEPRALLEAIQYRPNKLTVIYVR